jgi:hypothetical protein
MGLAKEIRTRNFFNMGFGFALGLIVILIADVQSGDASGLVFNITTLSDVEILALVAVAILLFSCLIPNYKKTNSLRKELAVEHQKYLDLRNEEPQLACRKVEP